MAWCSKGINLIIFFFKFFFTLCYVANVTASVEILELMKLDPSKAESCSQFSVSVFLKNIRKFEPKFDYIAKFQVAYLGGGFQHELFDIFIKTLPFTIKSS